MTVTEQASAKINLMLDVVGKRRDGYHELVTVMQSLSLCDRLHATRAGEGLSLAIDDPALAADESNLVCRAASAYFAASGAPFGVAFRLEKRIPMQAGLGGGSADAAAALRVLNRLDGDRFSKEELCRIGAGIGADVPFCVMGGTRECRGIGERMTAIESSLRCHVVVAMRGEGISTPRAFADLDQKYGDFSVCAAEAETRLALLKGALQRGDLDALAACLYNRFAQTVSAQRPAVEELRQLLLQNGAFAAQMSGSGPAVFGLFASEAQALAAQRLLRENGARAFAALIQ